MWKGDKGIKIKVKLNCTFINDEDDKSWCSKNLYLYIDLQWLNLLIFLDVIQDHFVLQFPQGVGIGRVWSNIEPWNKKIKGCRYVCVNT